MRARWIATNLCLCAAGLMTGSVVAKMFKHAELTQVQFFIEYWGWFLCIVLFSLGAIIPWPKSGDRKIHCRCLNCGLKWSTTVRKITYPSHCPECGDVCVKRVWEVT